MAVSFDDVVCTGESHPGESDQGALFVIIEGDEYVIPKSQVDDDSEVYAKGHEGKLVISDWIADKKGLI